MNNILEAIISNATWKQGDPLNVLFFGDLEPNDTRHNWISINNADNVTPYNLVFVCQPEKNADRAYRVASSHQIPAICLHTEVNLKQDEIWPFSKTMKRFYNLFDSKDIANTLMYYGEPTIVDSTDIGALEKECDLCMQSCYFTKFN